MSLLFLLIKAMPEEITHPRAGLGHAWQGSSPQTCDVGPSPCSLNLYPQPHPCCPHRQAAGHPGFPKQPSPPPAFLDVTRLT